MNKNIKKLTVAALLIALAVSTSTFFIPVGVSKCYPIQHMINVICAVVLGPLYAVGVAFSTSLIRNILGTGSLLAFPGSMIGAFLAAYAYAKTSKISLAFIGEVIGTGIIGGIVAYPVAVFLMGKDVATFVFVIPFVISSLGGAIIGFVLVVLLKRTKVLDQF